MAFINDLAQISGNISESILYTIAKPKNLHVLFVYGSGFDEIFNGKLRDELLRGMILDMLYEAKVLIVS